MLLFLAATPTLLLDIPRPRSFGDWLAVCDNTRQCEAIALPREDVAEEQMTLTMIRGPEPTDAPEVEFSAAFGEDLPDGGWRIDGKPATLWGVALLRALAGARHAEWVLPSGKVYATLPVQGTAAALRWIDDQQGRANTVTAMIATGTQSPPAVPPPSLPRIASPAASALPPKRLDAAAIEEVRKRNDCDPDRSEAEFHRLDAAHSIGIIVCSMGAYQGSSVLVLIDEQGRSSPLPIEWPAHLAGAGNDPWAMASIVSAEFAKEDRSLSSFAKGRGLGDCGYSASWLWDGAVFRLASFAGLEPCRGARAWPSMWRTANSARD